MVQTRLFAHDANQIELRTATQITPDRRVQDYTLDAFIFIPRTLGITTDSYDARAFTQDTGAFVRLTTPKVPLADLGLDGTSAYLDLKEGEERVRRIKVLACVLRSAIKAEVAALEPAEFCEALKGALERFKSLRPQNPNTRTEGAWQAADEFVSLRAEEACTELVARLPEGEERAALATLAVDCYLHRLDRGYHSTVEAGAENEALLRSRRLAKRAISSVLWLDITRSEPGRFWRNVIGMVAAAAAMAFAVATTLWATAHYEMFSVTFVTIAITSYVVKDRIKDLGKAVLGKRLRSFVADHEVVVADRESGAKLGTARERFRIAEAGDIHPVIAELRLRHHHSAMAADARPEVVLHWSKEVRLDSDALARHPLGVTGLTDILRFNIRHLRAHMDAAYQDRQVVNPETRELLTVRCASVHHVNLLLRLVAEGETRFESFRVVLDQRGIKRIEHLQS